MLRKARIKKVMIIKDKVAQIRIQTVYILQIAEWGDKCSKSSSRLFKQLKRVQSLQAAIQWKVFTFP
jgi:hypothetical protein